MEKFSKSSLIKKVLSESSLSLFQKRLLNGFVERAELAEAAKVQDLELIQEISGSYPSVEIIVSAPDVKIFKISDSSEKWDIEYPYRVISKKRDQWERVVSVSPTLEQAMLVYLENKHLGDNNNFVGFAMKMLDIT